MNTHQVALQLYTVRDETSRGFAGTLRQVAAMGYATEVAQVTETEPLVITGRATVNAYGY